MENLTFFKGLESSFFSLFPLSRRERDGTTSSFHFASPFTLSQFERPLSKGERDGTAQSHSVPSRPLSGQGQSDTLEKCIISLKERGIGQLAHFISLVALRVTAGGRNP